MNQSISRFECEFPISVALTTPATRMVVIGVRWDNQGSRQEIQDPIVALKSLIVEMFWTVSESEPPKGSTREDFLRYGWSFGERTQIDQRLILTPEGKLVDAKEHYDRFLNVLTRLVVCPWGIDEDAARLAPIYDQLWNTLDARMNAGLELLTQDAEAA